MLRSFAQTCGPPETSLPEDAAAPSGAARAVAELADGDFLCLDDAGRSPRRTHSIYLASSTG
jgi:hypothetical protein